MKMKLLALVLIVLGLAAGYGFAWIATAPKYFGTDCPRCQEGDGVITVRAEGKDSENKWRLYRKDGDAFLATVPKTSGPPDCYCPRCVVGWNSREAKPLR